MSIQTLVPHFGAGCHLIIRDKSGHLIFFLMSECTLQISFYCDEPIKNKNGKFDATCACRLGLFDCKGVKNVIKI